MHSPALLAKSFHKESTELLPPIYLIHGDEDSTVPKISSRKFFVEMKKAGMNNIYHEELPKMGHSELIFTLMQSYYKAHNISSLP